MESTARIQQLRDNIATWQAEADGLEDGPRKDGILDGIERDSAEMAVLESTAAPVQAPEEQIEQAAQERALQIRVERRAQEIAREERMA